MTIYDVFETENYGAYSGSYTARIMYGSFFSDVANYNRVCIADRVDGIISSSLYDNRITYLSSYALRIISGSYIGHNTRYLPLSCDNEIWVDSCMISPIYYNVKNGANAVVDEVPASGSARFGIPSISPTGSVIFLIGPFTGNPTSIPNSNQYIDAVWKSRYPFMSLYKGLARSFRTSYNAPYSIQTNMTMSSINNSVYDRPDTYYSNRIGQMIISSIGPNIPTRISYLRDFAFVSGTWGSANVNQQNARIFNSKVWDRDELFIPTIEDINRTYFGIGPLRNQSTAYGLGEEFLGAGQYFIVAPIIRGWKYGVYNGNQVSTKCIFRTGRYGNMRDMLEQRPFSKFFDKITGKILDGPVTMTPASGTILYANVLDYVTATNPSYNPRDSGMWDYEYKSGQPYFDI
jgi:hypothetical protein